MSVQAEDRFTQVLTGQRGELFRVRYPYKDDLTRLRAGLVSILSLVFSIGGIVGIFALAALIPDMITAAVIVPSIISGVIYLGVYALTQFGRVRIASYLFVLMTIVVAIIHAGPAGYIPAEAGAMALAISIVSGAFLLGPNWAFAISGLSVSLLLFNMFVVGAPGPAVGVSPASGARIGGITSMLMLLVLSGFSWLFSRNLILWARNAQRRARLLEAGVVVSDVSVSAVTLSELLSEVVERIRVAYGFYHAQVFMLDQEKRLARLEASTGRAGEALLSRGHALEVGSQSVIGECTATRQPVIVNNVGVSIIHRANPLLPDTRAELALPLIVEDEVIGALDVQSTSADIFQADDVRSLQIVAAQLAAVIDKMRVVDELQIRANENQRLYEDAQRTLAQVEELSRTVTREGWTDYLQVRRHDVLGYTLQGEQIRQDSGWSAPMKQAYQGESSVVVRQEQKAHIAAVPLRVRGEVIGVLEVERGGERPWRENELDMLETLVERLGLAVENARLYEQANYAVEREQIVNRISQNVQGARSIDDVLQAALAELGEVLGASRGVVQISPKASAVPGKTAGASAEVEV